VSLGSEKNPMPKFSMCGDTNAFIKPHKIPQQYESMKIAK